MSDIKYLNVKDYSEDDMVHNLRQFVTCATEEQYNSGLDWYHTAYDEAVKLSEHSDLDIKSCVGILAVLAPYNKWDKNVIDAWQVVNTFLADGCIDDFDVSTYGPNKVKAWRIACGDNPDDVVGGDKITAFYHNILRAGEGTLDQDVTCDMWATRAACAQFNANKLSLSSTKYQEVSRAYQRIAAEFKTTPKQIQAIIWVVIRDMCKGIRTELETMTPMFCPNCLGAHNFITH
jgi:hypothetical protein